MSRSHIKGLRVKDASQTFYAVGAASGGGAGDITGSYGGLIWGIQHTEEVSTL
jgi:hypothetical protein